MPPTSLLLSAGEAKSVMYAAQLAAALKKRLEVANLRHGRRPDARRRRRRNHQLPRSLRPGHHGNHQPPPLANPRHAQTSQRSANVASPSLAILTDFPGFHLRLARKLKPLGTRNVYYVCPQFWAWRPWRVRVVRRRFAQALCIFPFEEKFYGDAGVPTKFIGHPLVGVVSATLTRTQFGGETRPRTPRPILFTLLPGSRDSGYKSPATFPPC